MGLPHRSSKVIVSDQLQIVCLSFSSVWVSIVKFDFFSVLWSPDVWGFELFLIFVLPLFPFILALIVAFDNYPFFILLSSVFFVNIAVNVLVYDHLSVIQSFDKLWKRLGSLTFSFLDEAFDNSDENESIESCIVLLRLSERSAFPVWHLFNFANGLVVHLLGDFG